MLLDTSGLLRYQFVQEVGHEEARRVFESSRRKITHNYVLAEVVALANTRNLPRFHVLGLLSDLGRHPSVEIIWVTQTLHEEAVALLEKRLDKTYSLCDAVSFVLMRQFEIRDAFSTDRHFVQEGFVRVLKERVK